MAGKSCLPPRFSHSGLLEQSAARDYPVRPNLARGFYPVNLWRGVMGGMLSLRALLSHSGSSERSIAGALSRAALVLQGVSSPSTLS